MTGSCNVITLNLNRIIQDWARETGDNKLFYDDNVGFRPYLIKILNRVYKYHIAFKTMLYELEDKKMFAASNAGYIYIKKLYSTIGVLGYCEAAKFLGFEVSNNEPYKEFLSFIFNIINEQNKLNSIHDTKRPYLMNAEAIPGEDSAVKMYNWDKEDGYVVPKDQNLYNCYFYNPWDSTSVLDKIKLHGAKVTKALSGGQAGHVNLDSHLSKEQYLKLLDIAMEEGCNYFTFNIPMSECKECGHVVNAPITNCPKCNSNKIKLWTRIIGYLVAVENWSNARQEEFKKRVYKKIK